MSYNESSKAPHHPPDNAFAKGKLKKEHSISSPFATTYDDGTPFEEPKIFHAKDIALESEKKAVRRPSIEDIKFEEKLQLHHPEILPHEEAPHAEGPHFGGHNDVHRENEFHPPGIHTSSDVMPRKQKLSPSKHTHFEHGVGQATSSDDKEGLPPTRYHHYTAPNSYPAAALSTGSADNEDEVEPYDPNPSIGLKHLDAAPRTHSAADDILHSSNHHSRPHHELQPSFVPPSERDELKAEHQKPLFSPAEAQRLAQHGYHHTIPEYSSGAADSSVFGFTAQRHHRVEEDAHSKVVDPLGHVSPSTMVSSVGNAYMDDEVHMRKVHTRSLEDSNNA